jgi:hypothetical protein
MNSTTSSTFAVDSGESIPPVAAPPPVPETEDEGDDESQQNGLEEWDVALRFPGALGLFPTPSRNPPSLALLISHSRYASLVGNSCSTSWNFDGNNSVKEATTLAARR